MKTALRPLIREARLFFFRWALREIDLLHEDVPMIVHAINRLEAERKEQ
jgi:hypothetical protein